MLSLLILPVAMSGAVAVSVIAIVIKRDLYRHRAKLARTYDYPDVERDRKLAAKAQPHEMHVDWGGADKDDSVVVKAHSDAAGTIDWAKVPARPTMTAGSPMAYLNESGVWYDRKKSYDSTK